MVYMTETQGKYTQNWQAYDKAQTREKTLFMKLLSELCQTLEQKEYTRGRPVYPISDMMFCSVMKVYTMFSLRRFTSTLKEANELGYIDRIPSFASVGHFMQREDMTQPLLRLVWESSLPLREVERDFATDTTGFATCHYARWFDHKYGKEFSARKWLKAHVMSGVKTNVVTSLIVTDSTHSDTQYMKYLLRETAEGFKLGDVCADKAYLSRENLKEIDRLGGTPLIPFRSNCTGNARGSLLWSKMYRYFLLYREEFMERYHKRSNVETTFHMIKAKFGDFLRSKSKEAQVNEVICKVICHNLCVLIQEMHEVRQNDNYFKK
jgi:transposase